MFPPRFRNTETHDFALGIALVMTQFFWKFHGPLKFYTWNLVFIRSRLQYSWLMRMPIKQKKNKVLRKDLCAKEVGLRGGQSVLLFPCRVSRCFPIAE